MNIKTLYFLNLANVVIIFGLTFSSEHYFSLNIDVFIILFYLISRLFSELFWYIMHFRLSFYSCRRIFGRAASSSRLIVGVLLVVTIYRKLMCRHVHARSNNCNFNL